MGVLRCKAIRPWLAGAIDVSREGCGCLLCELHFTVMMPLISPK
jgi:hypothetical protein